MNVDADGLNEEKPVGLGGLESGVVDGDKSGEKASPEEPFRDHPSIRKKAKKDGICPYPVHEFLYHKNRPQHVTHYRLEGPRSAELVIGFHGLNGTRNMWQSAARDLVMIGYQVLTYDLYGHGLSSCPRYDIFSGFNYTPEFFVDQLDELLTHLELKSVKCNMLAFSLGTIVASSYACKYPNNISRIILVSPVGMLEHIPKSIKTVVKCQCLVPCSSCFVCRCCFNKDSFLARCPMEDRVSGAALQTWDRIMWSIFDKKGTIPSFLGCVTRLPIWTGEHIYRKLGQTNISMLLLWGSADTVVPVHVATQMIDVLNNAHLIVFQDCTHLLLSERSNECIATIATFFGFPPDSSLQDFQYLLPFTPQGEYRPPKYRMPPAMKQDTYFQLINHRPERWFKVRAPKTPVVHNA